MKKTFKKTLIFLSIFLAVIIVSLALIPVIFKDDIKKAIDDGIKENINGEVFFDANSFSVGIFSNFPNLTVGMSDFGVVGAGKFKGDTLAAVKNFSVSLDLMSAISGETIQMTSLVLDGAYINGIVLKDSTANYMDIVKMEETEEEVDSSTTEFNFSGKWKITNARLKYRDESTKMYAEVSQLNHEGSGDFTEKIFDLATKTEMKGVSFNMEGSDYLEKADFAADLTLNMDMDKSKYTFKENVLKLNDFSFGFDGWVQMNEDESIDMDVKYGTKETEFKNILSLVPGVFLEGFEDIKTKGTLAFDGLVEGKFSETSMPGFKLNLKVADAMFKYPDLPSAVENIAVDLKVVSAPNKMEEMLVELKEFHLDMGSNPVDLKSTVKMLGSFEKMNVKADANVKINLAEVGKFYHVEGLSMKGTYGLKSKVDGIYDMAAEKFPSSNSVMTMKDGYVKSAEFPAPIDKMNFDIEIQNQDGSLVNTFIGVKQFDMNLDGEPISMTATVENLEDIKFDVNLSGNLDFDKLTKVYPLEDMSLSGKMTMDVHTKGSMHDVESENYGAIPTKGNMTFTNFVYSDKEYVANGFKMDDASFTFTPKEIIIDRFYGFLGNSDLDVKGSLSNYINYIFGENQLLKGNMTLKSNSFDVDEWLVEEEGDGTTPEEEEPYEVIELPKDIDFTMLSTIGKVKYDNYGITNMVGEVLMKNGNACFKNTRFNMIGGNFETSGCYYTENIKKPRFDFDIDIQNAGIAKAYSTFNTVQAFAPIAQIMDGKFNTNFHLDGPLDQEMFPIMKLITGTGAISVIGAKFKNSINDLAVANPSNLTENDYNLLAQATDNEARVENDVNNDVRARGKAAGAQSMIKLLGKISKVTGIDLFNKELDPTSFDAGISGGKLNIKEFLTKIGANNMLVSGSNSLDGSMDYLMKMDVPSGALGDAAGKKLSGMLGAPINTDRIKFDLLVGGFLNDPAVKMGKPEKSGLVKSAGGALLKQGANKVGNAAGVDVPDLNEAYDSAKKKLDDQLAKEKKAANDAHKKYLDIATAKRNKALADATALENKKGNLLEKGKNKAKAATMRKTANAAFNTTKKNLDSTRSKALNTATKKHSTALSKLKKP